MGQRSYPFDIQTLLKDAGLVAASAAAQVGGVAQILDMGAARIDAVAVIDITAIEVADTNEEYDILIQGSNSASFASGIANLGQLNVGAGAVLQGGAATTLVGRRELLFTNEQADVTYRYIRAYTVVAGTISTGINYTAFVTELPRI